MDRRKEGHWELLNCVRAGAWFRNARVVVPPMINSQMDTNESSSTLFRTKFTDEVLECLGPVPILAWTGRNFDTFKKHFSACSIPCNHSPSGSHPLSVTQFDS